MQRFVTIRKGPTRRIIPVGGLKPTSNFPIAIGDIGAFPASVDSGGGYLYDDVLEYRVWEGDSYKAFRTYEEAEKYTRTTFEGHMAVLVLQKKGHWIAWDDKDHLTIGKQDRITEWHANWLKDSHYTRKGLSAAHAKAKLDARKH